MFSFDGRNMQVRALFVHSVLIPQFPMQVSHSFVLKIIFITKRLVYWNNGMLSKGQQHFYGFFELFYMYLT